MKGYDLKMLRIVSILILLICGTFQCFSQQETKQNDKAIVYFYSLATITIIGQVRKPVFLDDKEIADIRQ
jgi:hypothetical protein